MPHSTVPLAAGPLLETKFYFPRWRPGQVPRPRLVERMDRGAQSKLTLISAPPGFGKTTLLAEWLAAPSSKMGEVAWLSLDQSDSHPPTFWTYVFAALQRIRPGVGKGGAISMLQSPQPPPIETLLVTVLNEVAADSDHLTLVLDDYHVIEAGAVHDGIGFLLDHLPPQMHLVVASRADPAVPLPRLRASGELTEVRAADLRFTPDEAAAFLNGAMGLNLTPRDVAALESRTEGWIAALQLAALSMQGQGDVARFISAFTGDDRYIVDYLVEEVLKRQSPLVREFLLRTSILDSLCAPLCDAVTEHDRGKVTLEKLERTNLFVVPLDDNRQWYRYHHLFADVLRAHLVDEEPEQVPVLHRRASEWYASDGQPDNAIRHALAANDLARAAGLVELEAETAVRNHQPDRLIEWLKPIPDNLIRSMPVLGTYYAMALQGMGDLEGSASHLNDAERWLVDPAESAGMVVVDLVGFRSLPSRIALARGYLTMASGDVAGTMEQARRAFDLLPQDEYHWHGTAAALLGLAHWARGNLDAAQTFHADGFASFERAGDSVLAMISAYNDAELLKARGRLAEAGRMYERGLQLVIRHGDPAMPGAANLHFGLSELCCERDDLESARHHLQRGEELGISPVPPSTPYRHCLARARLRQSQGDLAGTIQLLDQAEGMYVRTPVANVRPVAAWNLRVRLAQGKLAEALDWTIAQSLSVDDDADYALEYAHITLARVLIARYRSERDVDSVRGVDRLLQRLRQAADAGGRTGAVIEILILQAIVHQAQDEISAGLLHLERALTLAEPEGYVRIFVDEGLPMRDLLRHAVIAGIGGPYSRRLLAAFQAPAVPVAAAARANAPSLAEPLTTREIEILRLVAAGMRNQEIADHLVISLPTVKRHIANTYGKLGVGHRTEAVARANELSLLEASR